MTTLQDLALPKGLDLGDLLTFRSRLHLGFTNLMLEVEGCVTWGKKYWEILENPARPIQRLTQHQERLLNGQIFAMKAAYHCAYPQAHWPGIWT